MSVKNNFQTYNDSKVQDYTKDGDINEYLGDIYGEKFIQYRQNWTKASSLEHINNFPLFLVFEPMWKCNLKCIMCLHSNSQKTSLKYSDKMPWEMYMKIIQEASQYNCPSLSIGGHCEPLLDERLPDMIALAKEYGFMDIMLNTNATLLNKEIAKKIISSGLTRIRIGFDGATAQTYEKIRIGANFEQVKNKILNFIKLRDEMKSRLPVIRISCVHLSANNQEIDDFVNFWTSKVDYVSIQRYSPHELTKERARKKLGAGVKVEENLKCSMPWERLYIRGNGDVYICCRPAYGPKIGNLKDNSLYEMWNSKMVNNLRDAIKKEAWESIPTCKECMSQFRSAPNSQDLLNP